MAVVCGYCGKAGDWVPPAVEGAPPLCDECLANQHAIPLEWWAQVGGVAGVVHWAICFAFIRGLEVGLGEVPVDQAAEDLATVEMAAIDRIHQLFLSSRLIS